MASALGSKNLLTDILARTFLDPVARLASAQKSLTGRLFNSPETARTNNIAEWILGDKTAKNVREKSLVEGILKPVGSAASFATSAALGGLKAAGAGQKLLRGLAVSNTAVPLAAASQAEPGQELTAAKGARGVGSLLNVLGFGANTLVDKLTPKIQSTVFKGVDVKSVLSKNKNSVVRTPDRLREIIRDMTDEYRNISNNDIFTSEDLVNNLDDVTGNIVKRAEPVLRDTTFKDFKTKLGNKVAELDIDTFDQLSKKAGFKEFVSQFNRLPKDPNGLQVKQLLDTIVDTAGGLKGVQSDTAVEGTQALQKIADYIRLKVIKGNPEYAPVDEALNKISGTIDVGNVLRRKFEDAIKPGLSAGPLLSAKLPVNIRGALERAATKPSATPNLISQLAKGVGASILGGLEGATGSEPTPVTQGVASSNVPTRDVARGMGERAISPSDLMAELANVSESQFTPTVQSPTENPFIQSLITASQLLPNGTTAQQIALAENILASQESVASDTGASNITVSQLAQGGVPNTKIADSDKDYAQAYSSLIDARDYLKSEGGAGKVATFTGNLNAFFGAPSKSSAYKAKLNNAVATLRKALIGAGQTEVELKNLNLPKPTDEPAVALEKLNEVIDQIGGRFVGAGTVSTVEQ